MLPQLVQHPLNGLGVLFALVLNVDKDVIEIHYHKNVKLFGQDLVDITLKRSRYIGQSKRHDLVLEMTIAGLEGCLLFITFPDPHFVVGIGQIELGEMSSPT